MKFMQKINEIKNINNFKILAKPKYIKDSFILKNKFKHNG